MKPKATTLDAPQVSGWWLNWFGRYAERYVRRNFHGVRLLNSPPEIPAQPLVVYLNHPSWWDPLICLLVRNRFFLDRISHAPIDAEALAKYSFFRRLGFFPVAQNSQRGAIQFLRHSKAALSDNRSLLWITPQGKFTDARERGGQWRAGLGTLAAQVPLATYIPLAIEYCFWNERQPEACLAFGEPIAVTADQAIELGSEHLSKIFQNRLESAQDLLSQAVLTRDENRFETILERTAGVGGIYDLWRRFKAAARLQSFQPQHGSRRPVALAK